MTRDRLLRLIVLLQALALAVALATILTRGHWKRSKAGARGSVAIVDIVGPIHISMSNSGWSSSRDADDIAEQLHKISEDDDVKAVVLRINSPGGTVAAVQDIEREIMRCRANGKKVVASMGDVAASGGYYLAADADQIVAEPGTITGSIGVILEFGNLEGLMQKLGVRLEVIKSGAHKDIGSPARALTAEERQILQASIDDAYQQFLEAVVKGRRSTVEKIKPLADGRIFTGRQAKDLGLIDVLGDRQEAIGLAAKLAGLPENPPLREGGRPSLSSLMKRLSAQWGSDGWQAFHDALASPLLEYRWR